MAGYVYAVHTHRTPKHISDWNTDHDEYPTNVGDARGLFIAYAAQFADRYARQARLMVDAEVEILQGIIAVARTITDTPGAWTYTTEDGEQSVTLAIRPRFNPEGI